MTDGGALYRMEVENVDVTERERETDRQIDDHRRCLRPRARYVRRALSS